MLYRAKDPNKNKWNGVGGKIEPNETPYESCKREILEETGLQAAHLYFRGILSFNGVESIYVYVCSEFHGTIVESDEGRLDWKSFDWLLHSEEVVDNIPHYLRDLLALDSEPKEFACGYSASGELISFEAKPLNLKKELLAAAVTTV